MNLVFFNYKQALIQFFHSSTALERLGLITVEVSRSRSDTLLSVGQDRTSNQHRFLPDNKYHSRKTSIHPAGFEPGIPGSERSQTHALDSGGHWNRPNNRVACVLHHINYNKLIIALHTDNIDPRNARSNRSLKLMSGLYSS